MLISLSVRAKNKLNLHVSVVSVALVRTCSRTKFPQSLINLGSKGCVCSYMAHGLFKLSLKIMRTRSAWAAIAPEKKFKKNEKQLTRPQGFSGGC